MPDLAKPVDTESISKTPTVNGNITICNNRSRNGKEYEVSESHEMVTLLNGETNKSRESLKKSNDQKIMEVV